MGSFILDLLLIIFCRNDNPLYSHVHIRVASHSGICSAAIYRIYSYEI